MQRLLSSPRRRRRLARWGAVLAVAGALAAVAVIWPNTGTDIQLPQHEGVNAVYVQPESVPFEGPRAHAVLRLQRDFVQHAVFRRDVARSYDLVTPELRGGIGRERWAEGEIPVDPFPAAAVKEIRGRLLYSYPDRVSLQLRFIVKPGAEVAGQDFDLIMRKVSDRGGEGGGTWQVSSWLPGAFTAAPRGRSAPRTGLDLLPDTTAKGRIGAAWLALPLAVLGAVLLAALLVGVRGWHRHRRALRDYHASRGSG